MSEDFSQIREDVAVIKQHILILNTEGGEQRDELKKLNELVNAIRIDFATQKAKQEWSDKLIWIVISVSAGALISSVMNLILN